MYGGCKAGQTIEQGVGRRIEEFVWNAVDTTRGDSGHGLPAALLHHSLQWHAIAGAAPGEDENVRILVGDCFGRGCFAGLAEKFSAGCFDQLCDPGLGMN